MGIKSIKKIALFSIFISYFITLSPQTFASDSSEQISSYPFRFGIKYLNFLESNSAKDQEKEGFRLQTNMNTYGLFFGTDLSQNDSINISPKFSSYLDKKSPNSGRVRNDNIELKYKRKNLVNKENVGFSLEGEFRHEFFTSNEKRLMDGSNGESHIRLTAVRDLTSKTDLTTQYRFYLPQGRKDKEKTKLYEHRFYLTPSYYFTENFSAGPGFYYEHKVKPGRGNREQNLNFRPEMSYSFQRDLELIFDVKFTKIVTDRRGEKITYHSDSFKTPTFELELTWNIL